MKLQRVAMLSPQWEQAIASMLRDYNRAHSPAFYALRDQPEYAPNPLNIVVLDDAGEVAGGLIAETQFHWLKISIVVIAERARRRGLGRSLIETAEQDARARGCRHAYVDTMDYQAPDFYRKLNYELAGKLPNWDSHGHAKYMFTKQIA